MAPNPHSTHHRGVLEEIARLLGLRQAFTLCVVVHTSGSSYRKAGALAVVDAHGDRRGVISGGCLESDLESAAVSVLQANVPRLIVFDTDNDDDVVFGSGSGCRGRMQVLLLPIAADRAPPHPLCAALLAADRAHQVLKVALITRGPSIGADLLWWGENERETQPGQIDLSDLKYLGSGQYWLSVQASCAVLSFQPSPHIVLVGAGPEAPALIRIATEMGWRVTLCDHREARLRQHGAGAERTICARPAAALAAVDQTAVDACLVMTHSAQNDREALAALAGWRTSFIGLLGPTDRRDSLLADLQPSARASLQDRLQGPVGIKLGGHGPEILALSICAQLQKHLAREDAVRLPDNSNNLVVVASTG
ncbi:MAG TPA: XdhC family protein [Steroidobacteraceae bacterium]|jgi:xanthine dehydrogenase accessory factor|nr:XdhC family protein [Steroidobacteraceae bacterium]